MYMCTIYKYSKIRTPLPSWRTEPRHLSAANKISANVHFGFHSVSILLQIRFHQTLDFHSVSNLLGGSKKRVRQKLLALCWVLSVTARVRPEAPKLIWARPNAAESLGAWHPLAVKEVKKQVPKPGTAVTMSPSRPLDYFKNFQWLSSVATLRFSTIGSPITVSILTSSKMCDSICTIP